jgi:hypothetical protein
MFPLTVIVGGAGMLGTEAARIEASFELVILTSKAFLDATMNL